MVARHSTLTALLLLIGCLYCADAEGSPPNLIVIYADDLGYGDISCNGATAIRTPNVDRLAKEGLRFTDGHSSAATCTPSRYAMMTGEYAWRKKGTHILPGDAKLIIEPGRTTMASLFQQAGYVTAAVGKWHLGLGAGSIDWNGEIKPGPQDIGFSECFLVPATGDRTPCVYVENRRVFGLDANDPIQVRYDAPVGAEPTGKDRPDLLKMHPSHGHDMTIVNGISRIGYMTGGKTARWVDEDMSDVLAARAVQFIERNKEKPFFLYFAAHDIHVPRVPHARFVGKCGMGPRGDAILEFDDAVGKILDSLDRLGLAQNTMVILSSDNGPVVDDGYKDDAVEKLGSHKPAGMLRGGKGGIFEGATRVPFLVRWPAKIKPGVSNALVCQIDFVASFAALLGRELSEYDGPDSFNVLPALTGAANEGRETLVEQGSTMAIRKGSWKYIVPRNGLKVSKNTNTETGLDPAPQLYDLSKDIGETNNLASQNPQLVAELAASLKSITDKGRSRP